jgi:hypothetical protein
MNDHRVCLNIDGAIEVDENGEPIYGSEDWSVRYDEPYWCQYDLLEFSSWQDASRHLEGAASQLGDYMFWARIPTKKYSRTSWLPWN